MDGAATFSDIRQTFRTPVRILLPKLFESREAWKAKAEQRRAELRSAQINIRDLSNSRAMWRERAEHYEEHNRQLQVQFQQIQSELEQTRAALTALEEAKKK